MTTMFAVSFTAPNEDSGSMEQTTRYYETATEAQKCFNAHLPEGWDFERIKKDPPEGVGVDAGLNYCAIQKGTFTLTISTIDLNKKFNKSHVNKVIQMPLV